MPLVYVTRLTCNNTLHGKDLFREDIKRGHPDWVEFEDWLTDLGNELFKHMAHVHPDEDYQSLTELMDYICTSSWDAMEQNWMKDWMKAQGFDSFIVTGDGVDALGVFSPEQIEIVDKVVAENAPGSAQAKYASYRTVTDYSGDDMESYQCPNGEQNMLAKPQLTTLFQP